MCLPFQVHRSRDGIMSLSAAGVKVVVVHYDQLPRHEALQWHQAAAVEWGLEKVAEFGADLVYRIPPVDSMHRLAVGLVAPDRLPIAASIKIGLLVRGMDGLVRVSPGLSQRERVIVEWREQSTGQTLIDEGALEWTPATGAKQTTPVGVSIHTPSLPGRYLLTLQIPALQSVEMPYGPYTVYVILTEPNTSNMIAKAEAVFSLEP
jgi:hypothetical protein